MHAHMTSAVRGFFDDINDKLPPGMKVRLSIVLENGFGMVSEPMFYSTETIARERSSADRVD